MKKIVSLVLIVFMVFSLGGCRINDIYQQVIADTPLQPAVDTSEQIISETPEQAVDKYFKDIQQNSAEYIESWIDPDYCQEIGQLIREIEYELGETKEEGKDPELGECKSVQISLTGYDIKAYYQKYQENIAGEILPAMLEKYSLFDLIKTKRESDEKFQELFDATALEIFHKYMEECRQAGKTCHTEMGEYGVLTYKDSETNEWKPNPSALQHHINWFTNGLYDFYEAIRYNERFVNKNGQLSPADAISNITKFIAPAENVEFASEPVIDSGCDLDDVDVIHFDGLILYVPKELQMKEISHDDHLLSNKKTLDNMCFTYLQKTPWSELDLDDVLKSDEDKLVWMLIKGSYGTVGKVNDKYYTYGPLGDHSFCVMTYLFTEDYFIDVAYFCKREYQEEYHEMMARMLNWIEIDT